MTQPGFTLKGAAPPGGLTTRAEPERTTACLALYEEMNEHFHRGARLSDVKRQITTAHKYEFIYFEMTRFAHVVSE